jgi:hypothetical protein
MEAFSHSAAAAASLEISLASASLVSINLLNTLCLASAFLETYSIHRAGGAFTSRKRQFGADEVLQHLQ